VPEVLCILSQSVLTVSASTCSLARTSGRLGEPLDLVSALKKKIDALPEGDHVPGLRAVLRHVEVGFAHLQRGQDEPDDAAFTDAIYRSNQAFEGGIKEAYRVLAGKAPENVKPFDIESYLDKNQVFRPRVLALFTNYRKEWRNPSTHDYRLDFDEDEALLACVSVAALACLVSDQIAERLAFQQTKQSTGRKRRPLKAVIGRDGVVSTLGERVANALLRFARSQPSHSSSTPIMESQLLGSISGYLTAITPKDSVSMEAQLSSEGRERADLLIKGPDESIIIELKSSRSAQSNMSAALAQVEHYLTLGSGTSGVLYFAAPDVTDYELSIHEAPHAGKRIYVIAPRKAA
jgi:hypothetical protein